MLTTLISILPVFAMIFTGYGAARIGIMPASANRDLNRFVVWIALPALMFSIVTATDWRSLWDSKFIIASLTGSLAIFAAGLLIGWMRGLSIADIAVDGLNASYSNAAYIGFPLFLLVLGPASSPYVVIAATLTLTTLFACSVVTIELGHNHRHGLLRAFAKAAAGVFRNPVTAAPLAGFAWWLTGWPLPKPVSQFTHLLGMAASPTALIAIGLFLAERPLREAIVNPFVLSLTTAKLILHPVITAIIAYPVLGMSAYTATLAVAIAALPTGTGPFMVAGFYARDGKVTSGTILLSTIFAVITIPIILHILGA